MLIIVFIESNGRKNINKFIHCIEGTYIYKTNFKNICQCRKKNKKILVQCMYIYIEIYPLNILRTRNRENLTDMKNLL